MNEQLTDTLAPLTDELKIDVIQLKKASLILRAINHKLRQQILKLLHQHGKMTVTEIYVKLRLEQSVASQHLAILRKAGYVNTFRDGKFIYYSVNQDRLNQVHGIVYDMLK
jgi:DNA-binding transcriptional ArsR family regulator